jgi:hypothetical protein
MTIDWRELYKLTGCGSGTESGLRVLELIVGEENIRSAVNHWATFDTGYENC